MGHIMFFSYRQNKINLLYVKVKEQLSQCHSSQSCEEIIHGIKIIIMVS